MMSEAKRGRHEKERMPRGLLDAAAAGSTTIAADALSTRHVVTRLSVRSTRSTDFQWDNGITGFERRYGSVAIT